MSARYATIKVLRFPERIAAIRRGRQTPPVHVQIILSDLCNQGCHFCAYRDPGYTSSVLFHDHGNYNPNRKLPTEKALEILYDCAEMGVEAVQFTGGGEPTVHPDFQKIVNSASMHGLKWALVTNGVRLDRFDVSQAAWIRVSLDAANAQTYAAIRNCDRSHFDRACDAIRRNRCGVGFVVTPENWTEVYDAALLAKGLGASNIRIGAQFSADGIGPYRDFTHRAAALCQEAEGLAGDGFEVTNRFLEKLSELEAGRPNFHRCGYQQFTTYIGADQNLYRCCVYAYNPHGLIGSVQGRRFKDAWREAYRSLAGFDAGTCERCQFTAINRTLEYVLADEQVDEAFV